MSDPKSKRVLEWSIISSLLLVVAGVPLFQALHEAASGATPHILRLFGAWPTKQSLHTWDQEAKDRSLVAKAIRSRVLDVQYRLFGDPGPKAINGEGDWLFYRPDVEYLFQPAFNDERFYIGSFDTLAQGKRQNLRNPLVAIRDFHRQLARKGIRLLVVPIPGKPSIYPEMLSGSEVAVAASPTLPLIDSLRRTGIDVVDLLHPMRHAKGASSDLYLHRDTHWSPTGVEVAAGVIADALLAYGEVSERRAASRYSVRDTSVERWGDLCEMSALPDRRSLWKTERVVAHQVLDSSEPYRDSTDASVLWLGDSYSRIYQTDAPRSAGIIAQVAHRIGQPLNSIVNDGGASTVVRQQLLRRPAALRGVKVVVWTFVERDIRFGEGGWALEKIP